MLNISDYIRDLLLFQEKLTLPGLGSFELIRKSAVLEDQEITPPVSNIIFNPDIAGEDHTLASKIADAEEIEMEEAKERVLGFINELRQTLNNGESYTMEGFGKLYLDTNNNYVFEKDEKLILDFGTSGFEPFELEAIEEFPEQEAIEELPEQEEEISSKSETIENTVDNIQTPGINEPLHHDPVEEAKPPSELYDLIDEKKSNRNFIRILSGSIVVILISFIILAITTDLLDNLSTGLFKSHEKTATSVVSPVETEEADEYERNMEAAIDSLTRLEHALRIPEDNQQELSVPVLYSEYHIIAGSFSSQKNADELQKELSLKGFPSRIIDRGDGFYRVSALSFSDKAKALQELDVFRTNTSFKSAWVLGLK
jgi:nucleoid DNA-binding protein